MVFTQNASTTSSQVQRYHNTVRVRVIVLAYAVRTAISKLSWSKDLFFTLITAILNFYLEQTSDYISSFLTFKYLLISKKRYFSSKLKIKDLGDLFRGLPRR